MPALPPLSLYIHIPWCVRKCPYCDFNSHEEKIIPEQEYVAQLLHDLEKDMPFVQGRALQTIFFGGGTPSLFSGHAIKAILAGVQKKIALADDIEITLEANPGTAEAEKFRAFRAAGVNRLSIGVQSFHSYHLQALGRIHDSVQAVHAVAMAQAAGFERINIDLMHGLPGQTVEEALADLQQALDLGVSHISWYQLTIEPNTVFYRQPPPLPAEEALWDIQQAGLSLLQKNGFRQYEVSAFAHTGQQCRHNLNYWQFGDYLGIGAGAHGKITLPEENRILRYNKTRLPRDYLQRQDHCVAEQHDLSATELPFEFMLNALRLVEGVPRALFAERTGVKFSTIELVWRDLQSRGLVVEDEVRLATTPHGFLFLNDVLTTFMQDGFL
ncbi:MAG TPA: radical SAM family heme chaperone HemW [Pseudomonadales bacterium]|nr:radical SAM family heme chaperone HemW [Pseudomonadales bacterium]